MNTPTPQVSNMEKKQEQGSERAVVPEDGYEWRKYGQKFIKKIGKLRGYFKCQRQGCMAKKRVEWAEREASNVRVEYEGVHNHASATKEGASSQGSSIANRYNLLNQILEASSQNNPPPTTTQ